MTERATFGMGLVRALIALACLLTATMQVSAQQHFPRSVPAGNYSGICAIGNDRYAVVSDKSKEDGLFVFHIVIDSVKGRITSVENEGFRSSGQRGADLEAVCYCPSTKTLFIASEEKTEINEYTLEGRRTGRQLQLPAAFSKASRSYGLEALTFDTASQQFFTTTEHPLPGDSLHRIVAFDMSLKATKEYLYRPDAPLSRNHVYGVSELCATGDGRLLVLERQVYIPERKLGATTLIRIYEVEPAADGQLLRKTLRHEFTTRLTLLDRSFGNYEALCQPRKGLLLLMADSQNQYAGVLRDWFKLIKIL